MSDIYKTGGPAFPGLNKPLECGRCTGRSQIKWANGMTLLDYFAAKAMQGMLAFSHTYFKPRTTEQVVKRAYEAAAAMLAEKAKREAHDAQD